MEKDVRRDGRKFYDNGGNYGMFVDCDSYFLGGINWIWDSLDS